MYTFTPNTKIAENLTTNVLIFIYLFLFFSSVYLNISYVLFGSGNKQNTEEMLRGGVGGGARLDTLGKLGFLNFSPLILYIIFYFFYFARFSFIARLVIVWWANNANEAGDKRGVSAVAQGLTHLGYEKLHIY